MAPAGALAIGLALARHVSDQEAIDRAAARAGSGGGDACATRLLIDVPGVREDVEERARATAYMEQARRRFEGIQRCC